MTIDPEVISIFVDESRDLVSRWEQLGLELKKQPDTISNRERFKDLFRIAHNLKGSSRSCGLIAFGEFVHQIEDGITLWRDEKIEFTPAAATLVLEAQKELSAWIDRFDSNPEFLGSSNEFLSRFKLLFSAETLHASLVPPTGEPSLPQRLEVAPSKSRSHETIRVAAEKLDELILAIGELSIHQSIVWHARAEVNLTNRTVAKAFQLSQKLTKELYDQAMSLRMQPVQGLFQRLERTLLDLSDTLAKPLHVEVVGQDVELDKTVIERIQDPLNHIVRNAIDHGIETSSERESNQKPPTGRIEISAQNDAFGVTLTVRDDGQGLDHERIRRKAIERGLISESTEMTIAQIHQLIFAAGFSTAEVVTDVSGRGVGMDIVRHAIEDLRGTIRIESEVGRGTLFTINLPTSVSIIDAIVVSLGGQTYVVPVSSVEEVVTVENAEEIRGKKMYQLRDQVIPLHDLRRELHGSSGLGDSVPLTILICNREERKVGLLVEQVIAHQQVVVRPLHQNIDGVHGLMGGTILGNGEPGLIVDIPSILDHYLRQYLPKEKVA